MKFTTWLALLAAVTLSACASSTPEQQVVNDAAAALGGSDKIKAVKSVVIEGEGTTDNFGQDVTAEANSQRWTVSGYKRAIDIPAGRARVEQTRTPTFTYFRGQASQKEVFGIDGDVGYNVAPTGTATRASNAVANDRRAEIYHHPLTIVRAALDPAAKLSNPRTEGTDRLVDITTANGLNFTLAIDNSTQLPARVLSKTDNTNLGDVIIQTSFADYQESNGLRLPAHLTTKLDQYTTADIRVTKQTVDGETGDLAAPAAAASAVPVAGAPPANVTVEEVAKGIWHLAGQSHHSVLVEFNDHLTLIEAPQNDTRSLAVIAKARELVPNKPLTHVVNTHHHYDHSGGIRAAVSEGLTIITQKANAPFYQQTVSRPHTIVPDALAKNPKPLKIETVDEEMVLKDSMRTINLYHIAGSPHVQTMLMAYFPNERILVEADVYNPGANEGCRETTGCPFAPNLLENIRKRNLRIDRIVPIHATIAPYSDLLKAVKTTSSN